MDKKPFTIQRDITTCMYQGVLNTLLEDKATGKHIIWATDAYEDLGDAYARDAEIYVRLIVKEKTGIIKARFEKDKAEQKTRTRQKGEVVTPLHVVKRMNDLAMQEIREKCDADNSSFLDTTILEITCGEAPFLVNRYDPLTGEYVPFEKREGILDRKLREIHDQRCVTVTDWVDEAQRVYRATYGYEWSGDSLLIARVNLLMTFIDYYIKEWESFPNQAILKEIAGIIAWNLWQMDGLTGKTPEVGERKPQECVIMDWKEKREVPYSEIGKEESGTVNEV